MTAITHIFFDVGGVLGSNGWDRGERQRAVERFGLDAEDFQWRHEEVVGEWEEGKITLDEYLDLAVFYIDRPFSRSEFADFMYSQSVPNDSTIGIARALSADSRFTLMTLNNESEELNIHRIESFGIAQIFEAFLSSCWLGVRKPMRRFYNRALGIAHAEAAASLFIDDREQNLTPARSLGMNVILYKSVPQLRSDLERLLDLKITGA
ncbi:MAG TPA: HAD-IA family hydrolase [Gemmatimonadaceae bacterium]|jgi:putative hydrolase of the HAD superfamily|nr:HAD-IA family hydrolase [Gemmatimonadaceae bacterium]